MRVFIMMLSTWKIRVKLECKVHVSMTSLITKSHTALWFRKKLFCRVYGTCAPTCPNKKRACLLQLQKPNLGGFHESIPRPVRRVITSFCIIYFY